MLMHYLHNLTYLVQGLVLYLLHVNTIYTPGGFSQTECVTIYGQEFSDSEKEVLCRIRLRSTKAWKCNFRDDFGDDLRIRFRKGRLLALEKGHVAMTNAQKRVPLCRLITLR